MKKPIEEFNHIIKYLLTSDIKMLADDIKAVRAYLEKPQAGDFWTDNPQKAREVKKKMKQAWAAKPKPEFEVTQRGTGVIFKCSNYEQISDVVGYSPNSVRVYLYNNKGRWTCSKEDEIYTVVRI